MRQPSMSSDSDHAGTAASLHSWISMAIAGLAIGASAVLCFASYVEADRSMERMSAPATQVPGTGAGTR